MRHRRTLALSVLLAATAATAAPSVGQRDALRPESYATLETGDPVSITLTAQGTPLTLELERFDPFAPGAEIISIDEHGAAHTIDLSSDVHLRGVVASDPERLVYLNVTASGTRGFVSAGADKALMITNEHGALQAVPVNDLGLPALDQVCQVDVADESLNPFGTDLLQGDLEPERLARGAGSYRLAKVAVETDYEFSQSFGGNTSIAASYATSLIAAVSTIYERDIDMQIEISFLRTYASNNDPYGGSDIGNFLGRVQDVFNSGSEASIDRAIVQGLSTRSLGGGVAYLATACDDYWGVGVSANLDGFFPDPLQDNSWSNWDLIVVAHEMGHNFGSGHTHDSYEPVIDGCGNGDCADALDATIMSYCHLCNGGLSNIDLRFHPRVQSRINSFLNNSAGCIPTVAACPADLNLDGSLNFSDVIEFLSNQPDMNDDNIFTFADVTTFLNLYAQGCP